MNKDIDEPEKGYIDFLKLERKKILTKEEIKENKKEEKEIKRINNYTNRKIIKK